MGFQMSKQMNNRIYTILFLTASLISGGITDAKSNEASFDLKKLYHIIDSHHLTQLEEVLPYLPEDLRENFTLKYRATPEVEARLKQDPSLQIQGSSMDHPRAVLFGTDARFVITFNGDPSQAKYQDFEVLQYNQKKAAFELYDVEFPIKRDRLGRAIRAEKNPAKCTACHGTDPKPFWGDYPHWPGFFGSENDVISTEFLPSQPHTPTDEYNGFQKFLAHYQEMPRYKALKIKQTLPVSPYTDMVAFSYHHRPNLRLMDLLLSLNQDRAYEKVLKAKDQARLILAELYTHLFSPGVVSIGTAWCAMPKLKGTMQLTKNQLVQLDHQLHQSCLFHQSHSEACEDAGNPSSHFYSAPLTKVIFGKKTDPSLFSSIMFVDENPPNFRLGFSDVHQYFEVGGDRIFSVFESHFPNIAKYFHRNRYDVTQDQVLVENDDDRLFAKNFGTFEFSNDFDIESPESIKACNLITETMMSLWTITGDPEPTPDFYAQP